MGKIAIVVSEGELTLQHQRLARILDFFGVPQRTATLHELAALAIDPADLVVFGEAETLASVLQQLSSSSDTSAHAGYYAYTSEDRSASERGVQILCGNSDIRLQPAPAVDLAVRVAHDIPEIAGTMAGVQMPAKLRQEDRLLLFPLAEPKGLHTVISAEDKPVFVRSYHQSRQIFVCASSYMVDLEQPVEAGHYDVKTHFCSAVPLVMFIKAMFPEISWGPQELGACLIIDDPLLRPRYGYCDFQILREAMQRYGFTTNIAFIPWNWRRTSSRDGSFFNREPKDYSISVHGCDHTKAEFGETSGAILTSKAMLAQSRMRNHEGRSGIQHDAVMVFPQGVFSSACPEVLKRAGFLAAVNTEIEPVDTDGRQTKTSDVWDVAIMRYGSFPVFTRRYAHHGIENFAFDLLLGKPCLIVAHHDFFKNNCEEAIRLVEQLRSLNCRLQWRSLAEVLRRACRQRHNGPNRKDVQMFASELQVSNPSDQGLTVQVRKMEAETSRVVRVQSDEELVSWTSDEAQMVWNATVKAGGHRNFRVDYQQQEAPVRTNRPWRFELSVAGRRILSEFRDDYVSKSTFLKTTAAGLKTVISKVH